MSSGAARRLTSSELSATFDLLTPLTVLLEKCQAEDSEKSITQAAEAFAQQTRQCYELIGRLEPVYSSREELQKELENLQKTLAAKMVIADKYNLIDIDNDMNIDKTDA